MRIDRPIGLEVAADPIEKRVAVFPFGCFDSVVKTNQADPFFHQRIELVDVWIEQVSAAAVAVNDDRVGTFQRLERLPCGQPFLMTSTS